MIKLYDQNTDKIQAYGPGDTVLFKGADMYVSKLSEADLNSIGLYKVEYGSTLNRRYYIGTPSQNVVNGKFVIGYTATERPLDEVKTVMLKDLKDAHEKYSIRPRVFISSLGYYVDGSRADKENFEVGKDLGLPKIKDADNQWHDVSLGDYDTILLAIKQNGVNLWYAKNIKEEEIKALTTVDECIAYENTPYDYVVTQADVDADIESTLTVGQVIVKYKNKVKEWDI